ncbi:MAG TPA: GNAT family N-acetyltransferase, partial [Kofleriaceae bacterium]|nr:GNAT family N-acetyltransferase [Kofleriaceae bacterium]
MPTLPVPALPAIAPFDARLRDGTPIVIRAVRSDDRPRVAALFARMSPLSLRHRFLGVKRGLTDADLGFLLGDGADHVVLAAVTGDGAAEEIRGLGRYIVLDGQPELAEVAFEVGDADQGRGIGTLLLEHLATIARTNGITTFRAEVEADNGAMLDVFGKSGFSVREI